jgi:hypothetical protein
MTGQEFTDKINNTCENLNIPLIYSLEYGLKITNNSICTDKVLIGFNKENLTQDKTLAIAKELFIDNFIPDFINDVYFKHNDNIGKIYFGITNDNKEIYFEIAIPNNPNKKYKRSSGLISYDEGDGLLHSYKPFLLSVEPYYNHVADNFIKYIENDDDLKEYKDMLINIDEIGQAGFKKDNKYVGLYIFKELQYDNLLPFVKLLCKKHVLNNDQLIDNWFEQHKNKMLTWITYRLEENKITSLNLYVK